MANLSDFTRKDQIRLVLTERKGEWVDGSELATAEVGGSEGLRRLRELRREVAAFGQRIEERKHPDPARDIWQYRLVDAKSDVSPLRPKPRLVFGEVLPCSRCHGAGEYEHAVCAACAGKGYTAWA